MQVSRYAPRSHTPGALFPHAKIAKIAMAREEQTLANLFRDAGYCTHAVGKWHLGAFFATRPTAIDIECCSDPKYSG